MSFGRSSNFPDYGALGPQSSTSGSSRATANPYYHQLCDNISCNIFSVNNSISGLEKAVKEIGTSADSSLLRDKIHKTQQNTNELIGSTTRFLRELTTTVRRGDREQRLHSERLKNEFQATLQRYDVLQKQLGPKLKYTPLPQQAKTDNISTAGWKVEDDNENVGLIQADRLHQQQQLQSELEFEHGILLETEQRVRQIESDMLDVNQIFRDLASMVHEQGEVIGTIEDNVTVTAGNVESGAEQLSKASSYQKKYRQKLCWLVIILLVVAIILTVIIVPLKK